MGQDLHIKSGLQCNDEDAQLCDHCFAKRGVVCVDSKMNHNRKEHFGT